MNQRIIEPMNQWINWSMNQRVIKTMNQSINESWINESVNQWVNEFTEIHQLINKNHKSINQWVDKLIWTCNDVSNINICNMKYAIYVRN